MELPSLSSILEYSAHLMLTYKTALPSFDTALPLTPARDTYFYPAHKKASRTRMIFAARAKHLCKLALQCSSQFTRESAATSISVPVVLLVVS